LRKKNNIIISHPPDLSYGLIRNIINVIGRNPHNFVFLAGSIHESPGAELIEGLDEIEFTETWKMPFRAFLLNTFAPNIKIKLHADRNQLKEMIDHLEPKEVCFFHQSAKKLTDIVDYVKELGVEKVSLPIKRKLLILN
jgi:mRNA degradation ribonuclease J1/J2